MTRIFVWQRVFRDLRRSDADTRVDNLLFADWRGRVRPIAGSMLPFILRRCGLNPASACSICGDLGRRDRAGYLLQHRQRHNASVIAMPSGNGPP
jgi:hypothetical protein